MPSLAAKPACLRTLLALAALLPAQSAFAHTGVGATTGLGAGFLHPLEGLDHVLAMVTVGLWSGFVLPQRFWAGAATFMACMALGAGFGFLGGALPFVETGIVLSIIVFGLLTLAASPAQGRGVTLASLAAIAGFALFHGHAHAAEASGAALAYVAGFLLSTGLLHLGGIGLARGIARRTFVVRGIGAAVAASGAAMLLAG